MKRFALYRRGQLLGTYAGDSADDAWAVLCAEEKHPSFEAMAKRHGLTKGGYIVQSGPNLPHFDAVEIEE